MEFKIESNIPIPKSNMVRSFYRKPVESLSPNKEIIASMEVGDSFFVPAGKVTDVLNRFYNPANRLGRRITARKVDGGVRIWLTNIAR